jgi:tetratricopeptide (TPR) repeat protein
LPEREQSLTVRDRIVMHLHETAAVAGGRKEDYLLTQNGIADALMLSRAHVAMELDRGASRGLFYSDLARVKGNSRETRIYMLTELGREYAARLYQRIEQKKLIEKAVAYPGKVSASEVLSKMERKDIIRLCMLRIAGTPLDRDLLHLEGKLPFTVNVERNRIRLLNLSEAAIDAVLQDGHMRRLCLGALADYCLEGMDYGGRMKYLLMCGRYAEAEKTASFHPNDIEASQDPELKSAMIDFAASAGGMKNIRRIAARMCLSDGRSRLAIELLGNAGEEGFEHDLTMAEALAMEGSTDRAAGIIEKSDVQRTNQNTSQLHRIRARIAAHRGDYVRAREELNLSLRSSASAASVLDSRMSYSLLAKIEREAGDYREAARVEAKLRSLMDMSLR